jgi:hypothetical protein
MGMKSDSNSGPHGFEVAGNRWLASLAAVASYTALGELGYMRPGVDFAGKCMPVEAPRYIMVLLLGVALLMYIWHVASVAISTPRDRWIRMVVLYAVGTAAVGTLLGHAYTRIRTQLSPGCTGFYLGCAPCGGEPWYELMAPYVVPALLAGLAAPLFGFAARRILHTRNT